MLCRASFVLNVPLTLREGKKSKFHPKWQFFGGKLMALWYYKPPLSLSSSLPPLSISFSLSSSLPPPSLSLSLFLSLFLPPYLSPSLQSWTIPRGLSCSVSSLAVLQELPAAPALARERYRNCSPSTRNLHRWSRRWEGSKDSLRVSLSVRVFR